MYENTKIGYKFFLILSISGFAQSSIKLSDSVKVKYEYVYESKLGGYYIARVKNGKYCIIDSVGNIKVKPIFEYIGDFNVRAIAEAGKTVNGKFKRGYINLKGGTVIPFIYDDVYATADGIIVGIGKKFGVVDYASKFLIPLKYEQITNANEKFFIVRENKKEGYIGIDGKKLTPIFFKNTDRFYNGFANVILENGSSTFINTSGKYMFPPIKNVILGSLKNNLAVVKNIYTQKKGLIGINGLQLIPNEYDEVEIDKTNIIVKKNGKMGMLSSNNKIIIPLKYDWVFNEDGGLHLVKNKSLYGVLNTNNETVLPIVYNYIMIKDAKYILVSNTDSLNGVFDLSGKSLLPVEHKFFNFCKNKFFVSKGNDSYIFNLENLASFIKAIEGIKYENGGNFYSWYDNRECQQVASEDNKFGIINIDNKIVIPFVYDYISSPNFTNKFIVRLNGKYGIIDVENKVIHKIIYDKISLQKESVFFYIGGKIVSPTVELENSN